MFGGDVLLDVLGGGYEEGFAVGADAVRRGLAAEVGSGAVGACSDSFGPAIEVVGLLGEETSAFLLVEEEDGFGREAFVVGGCDCVLGVLLALLGGGDGCAGPGGSDLGVKASVGQDEEAVTGFEELRALADPGVYGFAGGRGEPVACKGEVLVEGGEAVVSGVEVAVEAGVVPCRGLGYEGQRCSKSEGCSDSGMNFTRHKGFQAPEVISR